MLPLISILALAAALAAAGFTTTEINGVTTNYNYNDENDPYALHASTIATMIDYLENTWNLCYTNRWTVGSVTTGGFTATLILPGPTEFNSRQRRQECYNDLTEASFQNCLHYSSTSTRCKAVRSANCRFLVTDLSAHGVSSLREDGFIGINPSSAISTTYVGDIKINFHIDNSGTVWDSEERLSAGISMQGALQGAWSLCQSESWTASYFESGSFKASLVIPEDDDKEECYESLSSAAESFCFRNLENRNHYSYAPLTRCKVIKSESCRFMVTEPDYHDFEDLYDDDFSGIE